MSIERTVVSFDRACRRAGVAYALVGGVAVAAWGEPRATRNVDALVILPDEGAVDALVLALKAEGMLAARALLLRASGTDDAVPVLDGHTGFHVDLHFVREPRAREVVEAVEVDVAGARLRIARAEETVAAKLTMAPLDQQDARSILARRRGRLDMALLAGLARERGAEGVLRDLLDQVDRGLLAPVR